MKKIMIIAALALAAMPGATLAQKAEVKPATFTTTDTVDRNVANQPKSAELTFNRNNSSNLRRVNWYYDGNGVAWSNICQTPYFWAPFTRFFVVGTPCTAYSPQFGYVQGVWVAG